MSRTTPRDESELLTRRAHALRRQAARALAGDPAGIHQCRVASRRLREAMPVLTAGHAGLGGGKTRRRLRQLIQSLGAIRELDVTLELIGELAARTGLRRGALDEVRGHLERERARQRDEHLAHVARIDTKRLAQRLGLIAATLRAESTRAWRKALAARLRARVDALARTVDGGHLYEMDRLHRVRLAAKKLRYTLELARESGVAEARDPVRRLRLIQDILGRMHDLQVLQAHVAAVAAQGGQGRLDELGAVTRSLEDECRHLHAKYVSASAELAAVVAATRAIAAGLTGRRRQAPAQVRPGARAREARQRAGA